MHALLRALARSQHVLSGLGALLRGFYADRRALPRKGTQKRAFACKRRAQAKARNYASSTTKRGTARSGVRGACKEQRSALL